MAFLTEAANRGSISTGYDIENSLKVERTNTEYLHRTVSSGGNAKVWCASMWIKRTELDGSQQFWQFLSSMTSDGSGGYSGWPTRIGFWYSTNGLWVDSRHGTGNARLASLVFQRDTSAWYHIVVMQDTTQSTDTNRTKIYINGTLLLPADLDYDQYPAQNADTAMHVLNSRVAVGAQGDGSYPWSGYIADVHLLDGQTGKTPSDFAEYDEDSGIWIPKKYTGAYGTNGFHLKFEDSSNMGLDSSGNGNNLTSNNITAADQATDTPTNNFATFNVAQPRASGTTIAEGGTEMYVNSNYQTAVSSIAVSKGKWYAEFIAGSHTCFVGFVDVSEWTIPQLHNGYWLGYDGNGNTMSVGMKGTDGNFYNDSNSASGATFGTGDIISVALDMDNRKAYWAVNGTYVNSGNPATGANPVTWYTQRDNGPNWTDVITMGITGYSNTYHRCNFGGYSSVVPSSPQSDADGYGTFEYAPPTGYYALCTKNLAEYG